MASSTSPFTYEAVEVIFGSIYFYFHIQTAPNLQDCPHSDNLPTIPETTLVTFNQDPGDCLSGPSPWKNCEGSFPTQVSTSYIVQTTAALASVTAEHLVRASLEPTDDLSIDPPLLSHHIHKPLKVTLRIVRTIYIIPNPISLLLSNEIFHTLYISYLASSHIPQSTMHNSGIVGFLSLMLVSLMWIQEHTAISWQ